MSMNVSKVRPLAFLAVMVLGAVLISAVVAVDADAARGGGGGGGRKGGGSATGCSTCVLTVAPDPVPLNSTSITISGSGFGASPFYIDVGSWMGDPEVTAVNGSFSITYSHTFWAAGQYTVKAYIGDTTLATTTVTVD